MKGGPVNPDGLIVDAFDRPILCMSLDEELIVGGASHSLKVFDADGTCAKKRELHSKTQGHCDWVTTCCRMQDGKILSGSMDSKLCLWEPKSCHGEYGFSCSYDGTVKKWKFPRRDPVCSFEGHKGPVLCFDVMLNLDQVATGGRDGTVRIWDSCTGNSIMTLKGHKKPVSTIQYKIPNIVLSGSPDGTMKMWDLRQGGASHSLTPHPLINVLQYTPSCQFVITAGPEGTVKLWDAENLHEPVGEMTGHQDVVTCCDASDDYVATGGGNGWVLVHSIENALSQSPQALYGLHPHKGATRCIKIRHDEGRMFTAGEDGQVAVYDMQ